MKAGASVKHIQRECRSGRECRHLRTSQSNEHRLGEGEVNYEPESERLLRAM
jgi:hypothetical protein